MKKVALLLSFVFVAGIAMAQDAAKPAEKPAAAPAADKAPAAAAKTHEVSAEFVSADATKKTVTLKTADGEKTVPMEGKAIASVKSLKANDKVTATCRDNDKGEHQAVTDIKAAAAEKK